MSTSASCSHGPDNRSGGPYDHQEHDALEHLPAPVRASDSRRPARTPGHRCRRLQLGVERIYRDHGIRFHRHDVECAVVVAMIVIVFVGITVDIGFSHVDRSVRRRYGLIETMKG